MAWGTQPDLEVRISGSDTNGGGVNLATVVTPYHLQNAAQVAVTDAVGNGTTTVTSASALFTSAMVGNFSYMQGGSGSLAAGWYEVVTFTSSSSIVVDRTVAAGTGITLNLGGALASPGIASAAITSGTGSGAYVFVKSGTYTQTVASNNASNGTALLGVGGLSGTRMMRWIGYNTNRIIGNIDTKPLLRVNVTSGIGVNIGTQNFVSIENITFDGQHVSAQRGLGATTGTRFRISRCNFTGTFTAGGAPLGSGTGIVEDCKFSCTSGSQITTSAYVTRCEFTGLTTAGTYSLVLAGGNVTDSLFYANNGSTTDFIQVSGAVTVDVMACTFFGNSATRNGVSFTGASSIQVNLRLINCIFANLTGYGVASTNATDGIFVENCAFYACTSGTVQTATISTANVTGSITLTGVPFNNAASGDFSLNNVGDGVTTFAGKQCRSSGLPGTFPSGTSIGYRDLGAVQHQMPPLGLTVSVVGSDNVLLWDIDPRATTYNIIRGTTATNGTILTSGLTGNTYTDVGAASTSYYYSIQGVP